MCSVSKHNCANSTHGSGERREDVTFKTIQSLVGAAEGIYIFI